MRMEGKIVVVTGAASGIGRGCAERFVREGARVAMIDIDAARGEVAAREISGSARARFYRCDVGDKAEVVSAVAAILKDFGKIDVLFNNAGINRRHEFVDFPEEDFDAVIRTNLKSVFLVSQQVARHLIDRGEGGAIVNMASTSVIMTMPTIAAYAASKGGIFSLTRAMALSLAPHSIRVNAVGPGTIATEMTREKLLSEKTSLHQILSRTPLGRVGEPSDVASVVLFLASDDAAYVTGQTLYIDGGRAGLNYTVSVPD